MYRMRSWLRKVVCLGIYSTEMHIFVRFVIVHFEAEKLFASQK